MPLWLPVLFQILQAIPELVAIAEKAFSKKPGNGTAKKELVMHAAATAVDAAAQLGVHELEDPGKKGAVLSAASAFTDLVVAGFNAAEVFRHGEVPETP